MIDSPYQIHYQIHYQIQRYPSALQFLPTMRPFLEADEARYGLMLGLAERVVIDPHAYGERDPYFATVHRNRDNHAGPVVAAALMTPPHGVILYVAPPVSTADVSTADELRLALTPIAQNLREEGWPVPTANGPVAASQSFAAIWTALTGAQREAAMATRIFILHEVSHPADSKGVLRMVTNDEWSLAAEWYCDFTREAEHNHNPDVEQIQKAVQQKIDEEHLYFWDDGLPVSMAGFIRPTAHGISIGPVYTPPAFRGRGYASSLVAQMSQRALDGGKEFCSLFTDRANPTSNHIYQQIGYRAIEDFQVYRFIE